MAETIHPNPCDSNATTVLLCGVGGQGTILAAHLLASVALDADLDVKVSEIHGMAQRGGAVTTVVRFGPEVSSMVCDLGCADYVVSFELVEALRNIPYIREGGALVVSDELIEPMAVAMGKAPLPANIHRTLEEAGALMVPADQLARDAGNAKASNVALLGALSALLPFEQETWEKAVRQHVPPKTIDVNLRALADGRAFADAARGR